MWNSVDTFCKVFWLDFMELEEGDSNSEIGLQKWPKVLVVGDRNVRLVEWTFLGFVIQPGSIKF